MANLRNIHYGKQDLPNIEDAFELLSKQSIKDVAELRLIGPFYEMHYHTVEGEASSGKKFFNLIPCINWSLSKQDKQDCKCPYCEAGIPIVRKFYVNAIQLDALDNKLFNFENRTAYEKQVHNLIDDFKCFCKDPKSQSYTPIKVLSFTNFGIRKLKEVEDNLFERQPDGTKTYYTLDDLTNGYSIMYKYNEGAAPAEKYTIVKGNKIPVSKELRKAILLYDISEAEKLYPSRDELLAKLKADAHKIRNGGDGLSKFISADAGKPKKDYKSNTPTISTDADDIDVVGETPKNALDTFDESEVEDDIPF